MRRCVRRDAEAEGHKQKERCPDRQGACNQEGSGPDPAREAAENRRADGDDGWSLENVPPRRPSNPNGDDAMAHALSSGTTGPGAGQGTNQPDLDRPEIREARADLAACFRMAARHGLEEGICNHFSALVPGYEDLFLVNPYGYAFAEMTASKLLVCDLHGTVVAGEGQPEATAFFIHARIHARIPRARVAFHTHMPYATALSMTEGEPLIFAGQTALKFYGPHRRRPALQRARPRRAGGRSHRRRRRRGRHRLHEASRGDGPGADHRRSLGRPLLSRTGRAGADPRTLPPGARSAPWILRSPKPRTAKCAPAIPNPPACTLPRSEGPWIARSRHTGIEATDVPDPSDRYAGRRPRSAATPWRPSSG